MKRFIYLSFFLATVFATTAIDKLLASISNYDATTPPLEANNDVMINVVSEQIEEINLKSLSIKFQATF